MLRLHGSAADGGVMSPSVQCGHKCVCPTHTVLGAGGGKKLHGRCSCYAPVGLTVGLRLLVLLPDGGHRAVQIFACRW